MGGVLLFIGRRRNVLESTRRKDWRSSRAGSVSDIFYGSFSLAPELAGRSGLGRGREIVLLPRWSIVWSLDFKFFILSLHDFLL